MTQMSCRPSRSQPFHPSLSERRPFLHKLRKNSVRPVRFPKSCPTGGRCPTGGLARRAGGLGDQEFGYFVGTWKCKESWMKSDLGPAYESTATLVAKDDTDGVWIAWSYVQDPSGKNPHPPKGNDLHHQLGGPGQDAQGRRRVQAHVQEARRQDHRGQPVHGRPAVLQREVHQAVSEHFG
jgi:hypothetical protein